MTDIKYEIRRYRRWLKVFQEVLEASPNAEKTFNAPQMALKLAASDVKDLKEEQERVTEYMKIHAAESIKTQLITIMIDQKVDEQEAIHIQFQIIDVLKEANYKFMGEVSHKLEYFTKNGWSPHIHIMTLKNISDGKVAQPIRRKLMEGKTKIPEVYRIQVSSLNYEAHSKYISGEKTELKEEFVAKDTEFRDKHNIDEIYYW